MAISGTFTANGVISIPSERFGSEYRRKTFLFTGDFGGGTITITPSIDGTTVVPLASGNTLTNDGAISLEHNAPYYIITLTGATSPSIPYWVS